MKHVAVRLAVSVLLAAAGAQAAAPAARDITIGVRGRVNAAPSIAAIGRVVVLAWGASTSGGMDVYASVSRDGARTFGVPASTTLTATPRWAGSSRRMSR